jgi:uncharacterized membrane protein
VTPVQAHEPFLVTAHVWVGAVLVALGFTAMAMVKGSPAHRLAGGLFVAAMLALAASGVVLVAVGPPRAMLTAWAALFPFYFALTGWLAARWRKPGVGASEVAGVAVAGLIAVSAVVLAETAKTARVEALLVGGAIAVLLGACDLVIALRGGLAPAQRIRRHLWRMGFCVVIATSAIFVAQTQRFPAPLRPYLPWLVAPPLAFTLVQMVRYRARRRGPGAGGVPAAAE